MFARFPYGGNESYLSSNWLVHTVLKCKSDRRVSEVFHREYDDTPIPMTRNRACVDAIRNGVDYLVMLDSDMAPDLPLPHSKPFWDSSFDFCCKHRDKPLVIAAPYGGPPPCENVYVFRWDNRESDDPNRICSLEQFTRHEAATRGGVEEVAALPTGLMIIDVRALADMPKPYFDYDYTDENESEKATTEDVFFSRNLSLLRVPQYCNWDSWAGHIKRKIVTKPVMMGVDDVRETFADAVKRNFKSNERVRVFKCDQKVESEKDFSGIKAVIEPVTPPHPILMHGVSEPPLVITGPMNPNWRAGTTLASTARAAPIIDPVTTPPQFVKTAWGDLPVG